MRFPTISCFRAATIHAAIALAILAAPPAPAAAQPVTALAPPVRAFLASEATHFVIRDVVLIDGTGAPARPGMSVEVRDGRITRVAPAAQLRDAAGAEIIDGSGHTLIPGLVMLHEHMFYPSGGGRYNTNEQSFPPLYLAGGATTIRTGGSLDPYSDLRTRQLIAEGRIPGPRMDVTGPYLEGAGGFIRSFPQLATPAQARAHVNFWMDQGVTSFKAYNVIDRATLGAAIEAAHARGAKVTGHLCSITYREAADLGIDNLEHGFFAATDWHPNKQPDRCPGGGSAQVYLGLDLESREFLDVVDHLIARGVALTSTLNVVERGAGGRPPMPEGALAALLPQLRATVEARTQASATRGNPALLRRYMDMERIFHERGGTLVAGTDPTGGGDVVPGYANQRAIQLLVEIGLGVEEAIAVATRNGARYLGMIDDLGTVEAGKRADLVLMRGDLTRDIDSITRMTVVFKDGVAYDSAKLFESVRGTVGLR
jgi:imidazolonepropionase-like amidohydrolase